LAAYILTTHIGRSFFILYFANDFKPHKNMFDRRNYNK
jgi:hypothetical protein